MIRNNNGGDNQDFDSEIELDDSDLAAYELDDNDEALEDETLIDEQGWQDDEPKSSKRKSRSSRGRSSGLSFNTMVIIGAVVVGGGVLVFNVMNQSAKQAENAGAGFQSSLSVANVIEGNTDAAQEQPQTEVDPNAVVPDPAQAEGADAGMMNGGMEGLPEETGVQNPPQPSPIMPADTADVVTPLPEQASDVEIDTTAAPQDMAAVQPVPADAQPNAAEDLLKQAMQQDAAQVPTGPEDAPVIEEQPPVAMAQEPVVADAPVMEVSTPVATDNAQISQLERKLDDVLSRMDKIESDLAAVKSSKNSSTDVEKLEKSVKSLKEEMKNLKAAPAVEEKTADVATAAKQVQAKPATKAKVAPKTSSETAYNIPGAQPVRPVAPAAAPAPAAPTPAVSAGNWELRAAQPGRAWVSKPGDRDMQSVEIGQTLPGIGKVTGIVYENGRWSVLGTTGQIKQ